MQPICFAELWEAPSCSKAGHSPASSTADLACENCWNSCGSHLTAPSAWPRISPAVTVMEGCAWLSSLDTELGWVARQNQAWHKMPLGADVVCPLAAELRGGTVPQHCLPTGLCARHSFATSSAPIINQAAAPVVLTAQRTIHTHLK